MIDIERQKENFKNHIATFCDYGNIKILDFKNPESSHYRIRFLFEEDYYRLHISGDLGELIATNYNNMTYEKFSNFVNDTGYFEQKIDCHSRPIYYFDEEKAKTDIVDYLKEYGFYDNVLDHEDYHMGSEAEIIGAFIDDVMGDFSDTTGIADAGHKILSDIDSDIWEWAYDFGKKETGILDLYMLAFKLAQGQLKECEQK